MKNFNELRGKFSWAKIDTLARKLIELMSKQEAWTDRQKETFAELTGWGIDPDEAHKIVQTGLSPKSVAHILGESELPKPQTIEELLSGIEKM